MRTKPAGNETQEQMMRDNFGSRDHGQKVKGAVSEELEGSERDC